MKLKNKIYLSKEASSKISMLAARTRMQPNLLCRIGFCLSVAEPSLPSLIENADEQDAPESMDEIDAPKTAGKTQREFNRYTLTGDLDALFLALLRQRCAKDGLEAEEDLEEQFTAHMSRGVLLLFDRVKNLRELRRVFESSFSALPAVASLQREGE